MTGTSTPGAMGSRSSCSPAVEMEEPRKKGSRGGKRSVKYLSKAQLARKRANDREAQRNIRQRTKEHIETLEKKVKELEAGGRSSSIETVLKRNQELESDIERLRTQIASHSSTPQQVYSELEDKPFTPKSELDWIPDSTWPGAIPSHILALNSNAEIPVSSPIPPATALYNGQVYPTTSAPIGYDHHEASYSLYTPTAILGWGNPLVFGQPAPHNVYPIRHLGREPGPNPDNLRNA
ncbi:hypothetical protein BKA65DRAFT_13230 [Rhexocercosporidium sp. MPI-PUGE-AT-0058]|nr:hypothetical protein BKA65DRAFT_13230 [Rhexocercosporidium sp. MPI-PUGE-AT-0058]